MNLLEVIRFSSKEREEIGMAWLALTVAFTLIFRSQYGTTPAFFYSLVIIGISFAIQGIAQKIVARASSCIAEFRSNQTMLLTSVLLSLFGVIFAAPGGVAIHGAFSTQRSGKVAITAPLAAIMLSLLLRLLLFTQEFRILGLLGSTINAWIALYLLLPFPEFNGEKVYAWDKKWYGATILLIGAMLLWYKY